MLCAPPIQPLCGVIPKTEFPNGREPITKEPDTKSGSLAKNGLEQVVETSEAVLEEKQ